MDTSAFVVEVWVHLPAHSGLKSGLSYRHGCALSVGQLVKVHVGQVSHLGVVFACTQANESSQTMPVSELKSLDEVLLACAPLTGDWLALIEFTANYYRRSPGEVAAMALPSLLKQSSNESLEKRQSRRRPTGHPTPESEQAPQKFLTAEQHAALQALISHPGTSLLHGATGSGKTEVYLRHIQHALEQTPEAQVLVMVPEINLTPQLEQQVRERFHHLGSSAVVSLHSGLTPAQRLNHWMDAHAGLARIILGTRLSIFASLPHLKLIVVDEEHDPSFKQSDGPRHSARDLAVFRGHQLGIPVVLVSATPSLESWNNSEAQGRRAAYQRIDMPSRQGNQPMPELVLVDMNRFSRKTSLSKSLEHAIKARIDASEQVLLLLNRRGYSPVLFCPDCQWTSDCAHCSAHQVLHKSDHRLHCHHCGAQSLAPRNCPVCASPQLLGLGQGTEQIEEELIQRMSDWRKPNGDSVSVLRMDADTVKLKGQLVHQLNAFHQGQADVLIGTQMVAKGHDFRRVGLVAALNPDGALFSSDFRAPERLFALLMQAAGRAGRDPNRPSGPNDLPAQMWIQTHHPEHHLFRHLRNSDYASFAHDELEARRGIGLPPFVHQALLRTESRKAEPALEALNRQHTLCHQLAGEIKSGLMVHHPVPMSMSKLAGIHRAQLLVECPSRKALQAFLQAWDGPASTQLRQEKGLLRWAWDIDPAAI